MRRYAQLFFFASILFLAPTSFAGDAYQAIANEEIEKLTYEDAEEDMGFVCPWAQSLDHLDDDQKKRLADWVTKLGDWEPGKVEDIGQRVKNFCCLMGLMDIVHGEWEGEGPIKIYEKLIQEVPMDKLKKAAAWAYMKPEAGEVLSTVKDLDIEADVDADFVRDRSALYAKKILGRLMNKLPIKYDDKGNRIEPGQAAAAPAPAPVTPTPTPTPEPTPAPSTTPASATPPAAAAPEKK